MNTDTWMALDSVESKDLARIRRVAAVATVVLFAGWEGIRHLFLMRAPMLFQHVLSVCVEALVSLGIVIIAFRLLDLVENERRRISRLAQVVVSNLHSSMEARTALRHITEATDAIEKEYAAQAPAINCHTCTILLEAEALRQILKGIATPADKLLKPESREAASPLPRGDQPGSPRLVGAVTGEQGDRRQVT
ncbi:MAG: hypothetical protein HY318_02235, partial [Armatimonadetes bacterium]|nr:hypothetical protein [Armatimonadota bacterium]